MTDDWIDRADTPRESERLDTERLSAWLATAFDSPAASIDVRQFRKGHSNLTYLVTVGADEYVLRRPPFGQHAATAHDMGREYRILSGLHAAYAPAPRAVAYCNDEDVIGAPFFLMERKRGAIIRRRLPEGLDDTPALREQLVYSVVDELARVHSVDLEAAGLAGVGKPAGYVERQISGWTRRYERAKTHDIADVDAVAAWLADTAPAESGAALIHNDFKLDNVVLDPSDLSRVVGVLDWEMATVADPHMDLGTTLGYHAQPDDPPALLAMPVGLTPTEGTPTRAEVVARYEAASGRTVEHPVFYYVYGLFKIAVVAQQIYVRFHTGKTDDPRFGAMIMGVHALMDHATNVIDRGQL